MFNFKNFNFDFLTPEQNKQLSKSIEFFVGLEIDELRSDNDALQKRCAELDVRCSQLKRAEREREAQLEVAKERISEMNLELMDSHRANVTLRESLEKEREHVVKLSAPRPSEVDAQDLRSQNEVMSGVIEKLKEELRAANSELREYKDFVKRLIRTMETAPENMKEARAMWRRQANLLEPMLKPEAVGDIGGPA
ncbi:MAG: hypothetical protein Q4C86_10805 [bacterium]|nr:hypothetical protein [bacterium]